MDHYKFVQNRSCEYFPCHDGVDPDDFNCLFCYCPLYMLGPDCGGDFFYNERGVKDCSRCHKPHGRQGFEYVQARIDLVVERTRRKEKKGRE